MSTHPVEWLSAFLDDELEDAERRGVAAHLAACPSCARHLRELAALDALARAAPLAPAPDGYHDALPGRVRRRIRADRPASTRAPWMWPLAAGLALAVLAPLVLHQQLSRERVPSSGSAVVMEAPTAPATTMAPEQSKAAAAPPRSAAAPQDERRRVDSRVSEGEGTLTRLSRVPQREAVPQPKAHKGFAAPPSAARANEEDRAAQRAETVVAGAVPEAPPAAAAPTGQEALAAAGRRKEEPAESADRLAGGVDAASPLKKVDAPRPSAAAPKAEEGFRDISSLPASTPEEARRAREAWRRFVALHPAGPRADEGRVRFIEAAVAVFRLTRDEGDRAIAEREGRAYLAIPGAPQASRVRDALRRLERDR